MSFKKMYLNNKNKKQSIFVDTLLSIGILSVSLYLIYFLWNYTAPVWGLPTMGFIKFCSSFILFNIFLCLISAYFKTNPSFNNKMQTINIKDILGDIYKSES